MKSNAGAYLGGTNMNYVIVGVKSKEIMHEALYKSELNNWRLKIVLIILCMQLGLGYEMSLDEAYKQIKYRKGKMINGSFVKDEDLEAD